jgi:chromate reductase
VISSSTGVFGGVWAAAEARKVLGALGARTLEATVAVGKANERLEGEPDDELRDGLRAVIDALAGAVEARAATAAAA